MLELCKLGQVHGRRERVCKWEQVHGRRGLVHDTLVQVHGKREQVHGKWERVRGMWVQVEVGQVYKRVWVVAHKRERVQAYILEWGLGQLGDDPAWHKPKPKGQR